MRNNWDGSPQVRPPADPFTANVMNALEGEAAPSRMRMVRNSFANRGPTGTSRSSAILLALLLCLAPALSFADACNCWTNRAGHALKAVPQSISGQTVTFVQGRTGKTVTYPLSVFLPSEQERLRCALKDTTLPAGLADAYAFSCRIIKRSRLLNENGTLSKQDYQKELNTTVSAFRAQATPFVTQKQLSPERLELILHELGSPK